MRIRILVVGIVGLVAVGAVAALGRSAPTPLVEYPVTETVGKADRLSLIPEHDTAVSAPAPEAQTPPIALVAPAPAPQTMPAAEPVPVVAVPAPPPIVARHRHEATTDPKPKKRKRVASSKQDQVIQEEKPIRTVDCNGNGLDNLMRSMRLKPGCL